MEKENMKLYSAQLYVVKDSVDYFTTKEFVMHRSSSGWILKQSSDPVGSCFRDRSKDKNNIFPTYTVMTTKEKEKIMIGEEKYTSANIFEKLGDYYRHINPEFHYIPKFMWDELTQNSENKYSEMLKMSEYYDNLLLIVAEGSNHRVRDIVTGYDFPQMLGSFDFHFHPSLLKVFETNQRIYANIGKELTFDILEKELEGLTKEEIEKRQEALLYIIEHAEKHWHPAPESPSVSDRILEFIMEERKKYSEKKVEKEKKKAEEEKKRQYIKILEQMRK